MKLIIRILHIGLVLLIANFMTGVHVAGFTTALIVAVVLGLLNVLLNLS
jgi:putative membrane protein